MFHTLRHLRGCSLFKLIGVEEKLFFEQKIFDFAVKGFIFHLSYGGIRITTTNEYELHSEPLQQTKDADTNLKIDGRHVL
jgi:hypothetical protein